MEKKLVSIIVPVYNCEKYLNECIESIINQSYKNIEILLIDDGSFDQSSRICDIYALQDSRVRVIHKKNEGVSSARNIGIKLATGKYIAFVDSDDYISPSHISNFINNLYDCDMVIMGYIEKYMNCELIHKISNNNIIIDNKNAINLIFDREYYGGYLWNKIFITDIIKKNNLYFDSEIHMCEDMVFVTEYMLKLEKIKLLSSESYYYRMRKSSMVWNSKDKKYLTEFDAFELLYKKLKEYNIDDETLKYMIIFEINKNYENLTIEIKKKFDYNKIYKDLINQKNISFSKKIKLVIMKKFKVLYKFYINSKIKKLVQYK